MDWLFDPAHAVEVAAYGFLLAVFGSLVTLMGRGATYWQARDAKRSAKDAQKAVQEFKFRSDRYYAFRDLSQASYALEMTKRHLNNDAWRDAAESYDDARQAIIRMQLAAPEIMPGDGKSLSRMTSHMASFCNAVDAALADKGDFPDKFKVMATMRRNYETIVTLQRSLQEGVN